MIQPGPKRAFADLGQRACQPASRADTGLYGCSSVPPWLQLYSMGLFSSCLLIFITALIQPTRPPSVRRGWGQEASAGTAPWTDRSRARGLVPGPEGVVQRAWNLASQALGPFPYVSPQPEHRGPPSTGQGCGVLLQVYKN